MSIPVYFISIVDTFGNEYFTNRDETWIISTDKKFNTIEEATEYAIEKNMKLPYFRSGFISPADMFSEKYIIHCRYFAGKVPKKLIKKSLNAIGVNVIGA